MYCLNKNGTNGIGGVVPQFAMVDEKVDAVVDAIVDAMADALNG